MKKILLICLVCIILTACSPVVSILTKDAGVITKMTIVSRSWNVTDSLDLMVLSSDGKEVQYIIPYRGYKSYHVGQHLCIFSNGNEILDNCIGE